MNSKLIIAASAAAIAMLASNAATQVTMRVSLNDLGAQATAECHTTTTAISADGRFVVFDTTAALDPNDTNGHLDVYLRDRATSHTERISLNSSGAEATRDSYDGSISADGRYVVFTSEATNFDLAAQSGAANIYRRDRLSGTTELVSVSYFGMGSSGSFRATVSGDGRFVAFWSADTQMIQFDNNGCPDVFVRDFTKYRCDLASVGLSGALGNGWCFDSAISADGRFVAFTSEATNLVVADNNHAIDVFVRDLVNGTTELESLDSFGVQTNDSSYRPTISSDGRFVAFASWATNLVAGDTNGSSDVFLRDRLWNLTQRVSVDSNGVQANNSGSNDAIAISADGRFVAFESNATNLVSGDTNGAIDVFVHDCSTGATERASVDSAGSQGDGESRLPSLSADGRFVAFDSVADNLVAMDTNHSRDAFVHDRGICSPNLTSYCTAKINSAGCTPAIGWSGAPSASAGSGFSIQAVQVLPGENGVLLYSIHGANAAPFGGGFLCVKYPLKRTAVQSAGSSGAPPCAGTYDFDFNARIASGVDPALVVGQTIWSQYWMRDPASPSGTGLTDGLTFVICK